MELLVIAVSASQMGFAGLGVVGGAAFFLHKEYKDLREDINRDMRELKEALNKKTWWG